MNGSILIVEDDESMASLTKLLLTERGYQARVATTAEEALVSLQNALPDLIISDIQLPGLSGIKFCELIKSQARTASLPVIMLTVLNAEIDKVKGLKTGADHYLVKPYAPDELMARVEALLRRVRFAAKPAEMFRVESLTVDVARREAALNGQPVKLREMEFQLLVLFLQNPGHLLDRQFIAKALWKDGAQIADNTLRVHMKNLRSKLGAHGDMIETVIGKGYKLNPHFKAS